MFKPCRCDERSELFQGCSDIPYTVFKHIDIHKPIRKCSSHVGAMKGVNCSKALQTHYIQCVY